MGKDTAKSSPAKKPSKEGKSGPTGKQLPDVVAFELRGPDTPLSGLDVTSMVADMVGGDPVVQIIPAADWGAPRLPEISERALVTHLMDIADLIEEYARKNHLPIDQEMILHKCRLMSSSEVGKIHLVYELPASRS